MKASKITPYDIWREWHKLCCDHHIDPTPEDAWDGAVDTTMAYMINELCASGMNLDDIYKLSDKIKKKFKFKKE